MKTKTVTQVAFVCIGSAIALFACRPVRHTVVYTQPERQVVVERQRTQVIFIKEQQPATMPVPSQTVAERTERR
jgi:hypothetical protein